MNDRSSDVQWVEDIIRDAAWNAGWNEESQIALLCEFLEDLHSLLVPSSFWWLDPGRENGIRGRLETFLVEQIKKESEVNG